MGGPQGTSRGGKRDNEVDKTVDIMIQLLLGNVKTDRQAKYKPKTSKGYKRMVHTPFSLGLSMLIHSKTRSKILIDDLADMTLGETYKITVNAEKLIDKEELVIIQRPDIPAGCEQCIKKATAHEASHFLSVEMKTIAIQTGSASDQLSLCHTCLCGVLSIYDGETRRARRARR